MSFPFSSATVRLRPSSAFFPWLPLSRKMYAARKVPGQRSPARLRVAADQIGQHCALKELQHLLHFGFIRQKRHKQLHPQTLLLGIKSLRSRRVVPGSPRNIHHQQQNASRLRRCRLLPERHQDSLRRGTGGKRFRRELSPQSLLKKRHRPLFDVLAASKVVNQHPLTDSDTARQLVETQIDGSRFHERGEASLQKFFLIGFSFRLHSMYQMVH